jgi:hypothetical protein
MNPPWIGQIAVKTLSSNCSSEKLATFYTACPQAHFFRQLRKDKFVKCTNCGWAQSSDCAKTGSHNTFEICGYTEDNNAASFLEH